MNIWHQYLIHYLPTKLLMKLHADCCELRALGWNTNKQHLRYIINAGRIRFSVYHMVVMDELISRTSETNSQRRYWYTNWQIHNYRGPHLKFEEPDDKAFREIYHECENGKFVYQEHDDNYMLNDINKLREMKVELVNGTSLSEIILTLTAHGI